jgi:hypothetical protein
VPFFWWGRAHLIYLLTLIIIKMSYSQTFVGVIVIVLGWLGISHLVTSGEVAGIVDSIIELVGIIYTIYQRVKKGDVTTFGFRK